jgi:hypothetical protein
LDYTLHLQSEKLRFEGKNKVQAVLYKPIDDIPNFDKYLANPARAIAGQATALLCKTALAVESIGSL